MYWKPIQKIADDIFAWAHKTGRIGSVEVLVDIREEKENKNESFFMLPIEILLKACQALQEVGKAEVFYSDSTDSLGVKFFNH